MRTCNFEEWFLSGLGSRYTDCIVRCVAVALGQKGNVSTDGNQSENIFAIFANFFVSSHFLQGTAAKIGESLNFSPTTQHTSIIWRRKWQMFEQAPWANTFIFISLYASSSNQYGGQQTFGQSIQEGSAAAGSLGHLLLPSPPPLYLQQVVTRRHGYSWGNILLVKFRLSNSNTHTQLY